MKLLITGGCGFIGSNFVRFWRDKYPFDSIEVIDKLTYAGHRENIKNVKNIKIHIGDICNNNPIERVAKNKDVIVHFAAESHVDRSISVPDDFIKTNIIGTHNLLKVALKMKIKLFHHVSTDEVFGSLPLKGNEKFSESSICNPHSPYSASKASSDHLVRAYYETYGLPITISNTSNNFGPYQDPEKLIPRIVTNLILGKKVPLMGKGENVRDWIYVEDHCSAIDLIIHSGLKDKKIIGETFCIGANEEKSNLEIAIDILKHFSKGKNWIEYIPHRLGHDLRYAIDASKIKRVLDWRPKYSFDEYLSKTIEWYKQNITWWEKYKIN